MTFDFDRNRAQWIMRHDGKEIFILDTEDRSDVDFWREWAAHYRAEHPVMEVAS